MDFSYLSSQDLDPPLHQLQQLEPVKKNKNQRISDQIKSNQKYEKAKRDNILKYVFEITD